MPTSTIKRRKTLRATLIARNLALSRLSEKIYWSLLQELGVAALLKLAVGDTGLAVATRARPSENREIHRLALFAVRGGGRDISQVLTIILFSHKCKAHLKSSKLLVDSRVLIFRKTDATKLLHTQSRHIIPDGHILRSCQTERVREKTSISN